MTIHVGGSPKIALSTPPLKPRVVVETRDVYWPYVPPKVKALVAGETLLLVLVAVGELV